MATTTKITSTVKIAEFYDLAVALVDAINEDSSNRFAICDLLQRQTPAKQKKFWNFYDANVGRNEFTNELVFGAGINPFTNEKVGA